VYVTAHLSKIHGLDWSRSSGTTLATCSSDSTVKVSWKSQIVKVYNPSAIITLFYTRCFKAYIYIFLKHILWHFLKHILTHFKIKISDKNTTFRQLHVIIIRCQMYKAWQWYICTTVLPTFSLLNICIKLHATVKLCIFTLDNDHKQSSKRLVHIADFCLKTFYLWTIYKQNW